MGVAAYATVDLRILERGIKQLRAMGDQQGKAIREIVRIAVHGLHHLPGALSLQLCARPLEEAANSQLAFANIYVLPALIHPMHAQRLHIRGEVLAAKGVDTRPFVVARRVVHRGNLH